MGIGANADFDQALGGLGDLDTTQLDIQSPWDVTYGDDALHSILAPAVHLHVATDLPNFSPSPDMSYEEGHMIALGVHRRGSFWCQHVDELCMESFYAEEELQTHFASVHFAFTRINPAQRYVCSVCMHSNMDITSPCSHCFSVGSVELWVYGRFVPVSSFPPRAPGAHLASLTPATIFSSTSHPHMDESLWHLDLDHGNYAGCTDTWNTWNTWNYHTGGGGGGGGL